MTIKKKSITIIAFIACLIAISIWAVYHYHAKSEDNEQQQLNNALAERFDKIMEVAYPLIENYAIVMKDRADSIESMARKAKEDTRNEYKEAFITLWQRYAYSDKVTNSYSLVEEYEYFKSSPIIDMLISSGEKKEKEAEAIKKLTWAGGLLRDPYQIDYDSVMNASKQVHEIVSDYMETMEPYHSNETNIRAWRDLLIPKH
ncbi:MAG: hypothetical protein IKZ93_03160 [Prevotella sp.]|nr:hypothetical protein [Prevotella sp.]